MTIGGTTAMQEVGPPAVTGPTAPAPTAAARDGASAGPLVLPQHPRKRIDGENFPVALRVLPRRWRRGLTALYAYARYVDDIGDEFDGPRTAALRQIAAEVELLYAGRQPAIPAVAGLATLRAEHGVPARPFLDLVRANIADQQVSRYATFADLLDYCALSANPVGRVVLCIAGVDADHLVALSDRICTGLQIIEHIQDVAEDYRAGRIYLPQQDMSRFGVPEAALGRPSADPRVRDLLRFQTDRAVAYLEAGAPLVSGLRGAARIAVSGFLAGGRAAARTVRAADYDVLAHDCSPPPRAIAAAYLRATVRAAG